MSALQVEPPENALAVEDGSIRALFDGLAANAPQVAQTSVDQRIAKLKALAAAMMDARENLRDASREELGLLDVDVDAQLLVIKNEIDFVCRRLKKWGGRHPVRASLATLGKKSYIQYEPKGVVLTMGAWNAPLAISLLPTIGAIAAGNTVMIKPSELAPHSARAIAAIARKAFAPNEVAVVEGGAEVAQEILRMPFNHIVFIGGHTVGRIVMRAAAEHFASVTLEMGGKNPAIVCASADVDDASRKLAWGRVANGGQVCIAPDYALVHESIRAAFIDGLKKWMTAMFDASGTGFDRSPELPRIVNARHARRVKDLIDDAVTKGATIEFGGRVAVEERFVEPTILSNVDDGMRIMQEEVFGPVLAVLPFDRREQVASEIRKRPKPLSLYLYSKDREEIDWLLGHTSAGSSVVNHNMIQSGSNPHLPFGGVNASGIGRLGGHWTFLECSNARSVVEDAPGLGDPGMMFPPYSDTMKRLIDSFLSRSIDMPDTIVSLLDGAVALTSRILRRDRM